MAGFGIARFIDLHRRVGREQGRQPDTTTGWSSTINILVADFGVSCTASLVYSEDRISDEELKEKLTHN